MRMISTTAAILLVAVLLGVPIGSALMNGNGMVVALAAEQGQAGASESESKKEETAEAGSSSASGDKTEKSEAETTENSEWEESESEEPKCTCKKKCAELAWDKDCKICAEDYEACEYIAPNVKILIESEDGWSNDTANVKITVEDVLDTGNLVIKSVDAKIGQNGTWTDITENMRLTISENCTVYVRVTDKNGELYERNRNLKCFDTLRPTLNAAVSDGLLSIQAFDSESGVKAIYVNGYEFTELTNGVLNIRLQQFDAGYQYFTIQAMDNAGNMSEVYKTANPYYTDPEKESDTDKKPAEQLPVSAEATKPTQATGNVTEHTKTDTSGNTVTKKDTTSEQKDKKEENSSATVDTTKGKEFYTIQTASEKVFYLVIDRDGENETVYFLTEISENDLLNTTSDNSQVLPMNSAAVETAIPTDDTALGNNNIGDNADSSGNGDAQSELGNQREDETADPENAQGEKETPEKKEEPKKGINPYLVMGLVGALFIAGYYFLVIRKKKEEFMEEDEDDTNPDIFEDSDLASDRNGDFFDDDSEDGEYEEEEAESSAESSDSDE